MSLPRLTDPAHLTTFNKTLRTKVLVYNINFASLNTSEGRGGKSLGKLSASEIEREFRRAMELWCDEVGVQVRRPLGAERIDIVLSFQKLGVSVDYAKYAGTLWKDGVAHVALSTNSSARWGITRNYGIWYKLWTDEHLSIFDALAHEIGHVLGFDHSANKGSRMCIGDFDNQPWWMNTTRRDLPEVDKKAIREVYEGGGK